VRRQGPLECRRTCERGHLVRPKRGGLPAPASHHGGARVSERGGAGEGDAGCRFRRCRGARRRGGTDHSARLGWPGAFCTFVICAEPNRTVRSMGPWGICLAMSDRFPSPSSPVGPKRQSADHRPGIHLERRSFEVGDPLRNCRFLIIRPGDGAPGGHDTRPRGDRPQPPRPKQKAPHDATARTEALDELPRRHPPPPSPTLRWTGSNQSSSGCVGSAAQHTGDLTTGVSSPAET
jgi:hypothetical protein